MTVTPAYPECDRARPAVNSVVRPEFGGPEGVERFLREIELAARLQHPHILPVFDSGAVNEVAGASVPYFVMPFVEGETLRQRLQRGGRLPVEPRRLSPPRGSGTRRLRRTPGF